MTRAATTSRGPGRPRDEEIGTRIRAAALAEIAANGSTDVTIASIARRAGVAKSTAYLRWPTVLDLLAEALIDHVDYGPPPDTGELRGDLVALAEQVVRTSMVPPMLELHMQFWSMGSRAPQTYRQFQRTGFAIGAKRGRQVFQQALDRGEIGADVDLDSAIGAFLGALLMRALSTPSRRPPDRRAINAVVALFVDGLTSTASPHPADVPKEPTR